MKTITYASENIECYEDTDLKDPGFLDICKRAKALWVSRCNEYIERHGEAGTCVVGAGFAVWYLPPRGRKPQEKMVVIPPVNLQRSITWESSKDEIQRFFENNGIKTHYKMGSMD